MRNNVKKPRAGACVLPEHQVGHPLHLRSECHIAEYRLLHLLLVWKPRQPMLLTGSRQVTPGPTMMRSSWQPNLQRRAAVHRAPREFHQVRFRVPSHRHRAFLCLRLGRPQVMISSRLTRPRQPSLHRHRLGGSHTPLARRHRLQCLHWRAPQNPCQG